VVDELTAEHVSKLLIPDVDIDAQKEIGRLIREAFELKDKAINEEEAAVAAVNQLVEQGRLDEDVASNSPV